MDPNFSRAVFYRSTKGIRYGQSILLEKLKHYCIRGIINVWFSSYLTGRAHADNSGWA